MSFLKYFKSIVTLKPWPLSEEWQKLEDKHLVIDKKAPVNLIQINFIPNRFEWRRSMTIEKVVFLIEELKECLIYSTSYDAVNKGSYLYVDSYNEQGAKNFELKVTVGKKKGNSKKNRVEFSFSDIEVSESLELTLRRSLNNILKKYINKNKLGIELTFLINAAHKNWKVPQKFKDLAF